MLLPGPDGLEDRAVHLWIVRLEAEESAFDHARSWLSEDETARAERFRFDWHRRKYILGRAALRALLGSYLGIGPADVRFVYGPHGKPALAEASNTLRFNASNSGDLAACAFTRSCEIGVDVEHHRLVRDFEHIANRFFSPAEAAEVLALPESGKVQGFFNCWTRKESYIKALGGGLSIPLDSFEVTLRPGVAPRMLSLDGSAEAARCWTLHEFAPAEGYTGAMAYRDAPRIVLEKPLIPAGELLVNSVR
ncbi:MAG TPA: 4'-phosphopantetheinyl transferase superfamily protein [Bryobacteraceae bacterium]|nr:4'-phosphopantetheinyl transferase superfamily protein [Bryobacteraceae bacterium]